MPDEVVAPPSGIQLLIGVKPPPILVNHKIVVEVIK